MCRMLVAVGKPDMKVLVEGMKKMSQDDIDFHEFNQEKGLGSWQHTDGWGIAYEQNGKWIVKKSILPFFADTEVESLKTITSSAVILHVRKKIGSETALENTHPFHIMLEENKEHIFCHNGYIPGNIVHNPIFVPQGKTDSERLFYALLTLLQDKTLSTTIAVETILKNYQSSRGTNIIFANTNHIAIGLQHTSYPRYYQMSVATQPTTIIVSSEQFSPTLSWKKIALGSVAIIENTRSPKLIAVQ